MKEIVKRNNGVNLTFWLNFFYYTLIYSSVGLFILEEKNIFEYSASQFSALTRFSNQRFANEKCSNLSIKNKPNLYGKNYL